MNIHYLYTCNQKSNLILGFCNLIRQNQTNFISNCSWCQNIRVDTCVDSQFTQGKVLTNSSPKTQHWIPIVALPPKQLWVYSTKLNYWTVTELSSLTITSGKFSRSNKKEKYPNEINGE